VEAWKQDVLFPRENCLDNHSFFFQDAPEEFPVMLFNCGRSRTGSSRYYWDGLQRGNREMFIWQYTLKGEGRLRTEKGDFRLPPGRAFWVHVPGPHVYFLPRSSASWEFVYVTLTGSELIRLGLLLEQRFGNVFSHSCGSPTVNAAENMLSEYRQLYPGSRFRASQLAYQFLMTLWDELETGTPLPPGKRLLTQLDSYLLQHPEKMPEIGKLATRFGCSRSHFSRLIRSASGVSPQGYASRQKMLFAVRILQTEAVSVKEVAARVGFADPSYFCRVFRRIMGDSPAQYRRHRASIP